MARQKEPVALLRAKGKSHYGSNKLKEREKTEIKPILDIDELEAPSNLKGKEKKKFLKLAWQLDRLGILGETDLDTLETYVIAKSFFDKYTKDIRKLADSEDPALIESASRQATRWFDIAHKCAKSLGLTITDRCKIVSPKLPEEKPKNKFEAFLNKEIS